MSKNVTISEKSEIFSEKSEKVDDGEKLSDKKEVKVVRIEDGDKKKDKKRDKNKDVAEVLILEDETGKEFRRRSDIEVIRKIPDHKRNVFFTKSAPRDNIFTRRIIPISSAPKVLFILINFIHMPIVGFFVFSGLYMISFRELLMSIFMNDKVRDSRNLYCNFERHSSGPIFGVHVDGIRLLILSSLIIFLCLLGTIGAYIHNKILMAIWSLNGVIVLLEMYLTYYSDLSVPAGYYCTTEVYQKLDNCFHANMELYWSEPNSAKSIDAIQYAFGCCGARTPFDYYENSLRLPSSCCASPYNKNVYCSGFNTIWDLNYNPIISKKGCLDEIRNSCEAVRRILRYGIRPWIQYHFLLFIIGLILLLLQYSELSSSQKANFYKEEEVRKLKFKDVHTPGCEETPDAVMEEFIASFRKEYNVSSELFPEPPPPVPIQSPTLIQLREAELKVAIEERDKSRQQLTSLLLQATKRLSQVEEVITNNGLGNEEEGEEEMVKEIGFKPIKGTFESRNFRDFDDNESDSDEDERKKRKLKNKKRFNWQFWKWNEKNSFNLNEVANRGAKAGGAQQSSSPPPQNEKNSKKLNTPHGK